MTTVRHEITEPLAARGTMSMDDNARLHVEFDLDLAPLIARAAMTRQMPDVLPAVQGAVGALLHELGKRFASAIALSCARVAGPVQ